jgi:hypothetical protein
VEVLPARLPQRVAEIEPLIGRAVSCIRPEKEEMTQKH